LAHAVGSSADIADSAAIANELDRYRPDVVINCAAKTGRPNVDWCETHKPATLRSNVTGPLVLAEQCLARNIFLVHLSSGCVYLGDNDGRRFCEEDAPNFVGSYYVRTKLYAEQLLAEFPILILRPRMLFDGSLNERNLIIKLTKYRRILQEPNSLTYVPDLVSAARLLIAQRATGIFHVVNRGTMSPWEIMVRYNQVVDPEHTFDSMCLSQLQEVAIAGRSNCVLSVDKLCRSGFQPRDIHDALSEALESIRQTRNRC
jgi:3,5-epimerase/4-reductase